MLQYLFQRKMQTTKHPNKDNYFKQTEIFDSIPSPLKIQVLIVQTDNDCAHKTQVKLHSIKSDISVKTSNWASQMNSGSIIETANLNRNTPQWKEIRV